MADRHVDVCEPAWREQSSPLGLLLPLVTGDSVSLFKSGQQAPYLNTCTRTVTAAGLGVKGNVFSFSVHSLSPCVSLRTGSILERGFSEKAAWLLHLSSHHSTQT